MAFITAPTLRVKGVQWTLDRPASVNVSAYSGQRTAALSPWHGKWTAHVDLAAIQGESAFSAIRSFIAKCKGSLSTFYLPATVEVQNANASVTVSVAASAGATGLAITGYTTALTEGQYFTVNGQLCCCTDDQIGDSLAFEPALREDAALGTAVETANPYAIVYMANTQSGWNITPGRMFGLSFDVVEAVKERPPLFFDTFTDPASTNIRLRGRVQSRVLFGYQPVPARWRAFSGIWGADGAGYAYATSAAGDAGNLLHACLLAPAGTAGDRKITTVIQMTDSTTRGGAVISFDGRYAIIWEWYDAGGGAGKNFRIRQADMFAFAPPYSSTGGNAWTDLAVSGAIPGFAYGTTDQEFVATLVGTTATVTHTASGTSISATVTVPIGPEFGITNNAVTGAAKIRSVKCESIGATTLFGLGNGVSLADMRTIQWGGDVDGISMADVNGDGLPDLIYGVSQNGNGVIGGLYKATQSPKDVWKSAPISVNTSISVTDKWNGVEGMCMVPINGVYSHAFVNDTPTQGQWLVNMTTGARLQLSTNGAGQDARILTIAGEQVIVATYEGGTALNGGLVGYRYLGGDPLTLANWQIFTLVTRPGAWGRPKSNAGFLDLDGDGIADQLVYSARDNSNAGVTAPGIYSVKMPANPFTTPWTETALYVATDGTDLINIDVGDFSGDGNGLDILYAVLNTTAAPKYLRKSTAWTVTSTLTLGLSSSCHLYNVMTMPTRGTGTRDGFLAWVSFQGFYHVYWNGSAWVAKMFHGDNFDHGWNAVNGAIATRDDGSHSIYIGNSFTNDLLEMRVR